MRASEAMLVFLVCALLFIGVGPAFLTLGLPGAALVEVVCLALPSLVYAARRGGIRRTLSPGRPPARALLGAAMIGMSFWYLLVWAVMPVQERLAPTPPELERQLAFLTAGNEPLWVPILLVGLVPAICEEILCRGVVLFGLATRGRVLGVVSAAVLFALLHLSPYRLLPTFLLGVSLGTVALFSRSVLPAILLHFLHNSMVLVASRLEPALLESPDARLGFAALVMSALGHLLVIHPFGTTAQKTVR